MERKHLPMPVVLNHFLHILAFYRTILPDLPSVHSMVLIY